MVKRKTSNPEKKVMTKKAEKNLNDSIEKNRKLLEKLAEM